MKLLHLLLLIAAISMAACDSETSKKEIVEQKVYTPVTITPDTVIRIILNDSLSRNFLMRGREIAGATKVALKSELKKAIKEGGVEYAVEFCHTRAMEITDSISLAEKVIIKRVARKNRNPYNETSENENNLFKSYAINHMNGTNMKSTVSWDVKGRPVYYNPIIVEAACLNCHGTVGKEVTPAVAERIAELYPDDKATNFKLGDLRGMWSITFPEYMVMGAE